MKSLKSVARRARTPGFETRWLLSLVGASLLVFATGCPLQVNDPKSEDGRVSGSLVAFVQRLPNMAVQTIECEPYVLAIAIPSNHVVSGLEVLADGKPAAVDFQVDPALQLLLRDSLGVCGFDAANHDLLTVSVSGSEPCSLDFVYDFSFFLRDEFNAPQDLDRLISGGALESDLLDGGLLPTFDCVDEPVEVLTVPPDSDVPTLSTWGIVALALLLMAGGKAHYGRRGAATIR